MRPTPENGELVVEPREVPQSLRGRYVTAADASKTSLREVMGLDSRCRTFKVRFLLADVNMKAPLPAERWFWFDLPFHRNQSVLMNSQPYVMCRTDFDLGRDADPVGENATNRENPLVRALPGPRDKCERE
ncbi:FAD-dependent oxidoreductase, partial [Burkholderia pseudomallei]